MIGSILGAFGRFGRPSASASGWRTFGRQDYQGFLRRSRTGRSGAMIPNGSGPEATAMISELFQAATQLDANVDLMTGRLHPDVYTPLGADLGHFLSPRRDGSHRQIRVLVDDDPSTLTGNPIFNQLREYPGAATIRALNQSCGRLPHFMLVGDSAFRVELSHDTFRAVGCFDDKDKVLTPLLAARFNQAWQSANEFAIIT